MSDRSDGPEADGPEADEPGADAEHTRVLTFLIADVRGWTLFTQQRGDEVAAKLAKKFADIAREVVDRRDGEVIELRGDEALAVFPSARQAVRAAVDLQERFVEETIDDPDMPLPVGIGLDAGEAVPVEGGYRGGALNLAARLCGQAKAGEILASRGVTHLARKVDGVRYLDKGTVRLKNLTDPVELVRVVPEGEDPAERLRTALPAPGPSPRRSRDRVAVAAGLVLALVIAAVVVLRDDAPPTISAGSVGLLGASGDLQGSAEVGELPTGVVRGLDALWVTDQQSRSVVRVDPTTFRVIERIPVGAGPTGVTTAGGLVWVANADERTISVVDPDAHRVVDTIVVGNGPSGIVADADRVWVANSVDATVTEIDTADGAVVATHPVGDRPVSLAAASGAIWVANQGGGTVSRVVSGEGVTQSIPVGRAPVSIARGAGVLWVANAEDGTVTRIDPSTGTVTGTARLGGSPVALTAGAEAAWAADAGGTVERIDAAAANVTDTFEVGNAPRVLAADGDGVWVGVQASPASHRGGTLRIVSERGVTSVDPAAGPSDGLAASVFSVMYDGLVTFRRAGGAAGLAVVPDLAAAVPVPTDGGQTYTFRLRDGVRFSDGREVTPQDVVATFERILTMRRGWSRSLLPELVGGTACTEQGPSACDLSEGVIADEAARTVTFRLVRRAPDFLTILAGLNFVILPADTPLAIEEPVPGTGPYEIGELAEDGSAVLTRNQEFREWSADAQPSAFADRVEIAVGVIPQQQVAAVEEGDADLASDGVPYELLDALDRRASDQLVRSQAFFILAFALNTVDGPFEDVDARRAVASALDRGSLAEPLPSTGLAQEAPVTCQMIPPNIPGYTPYCPFGRPGDLEGSWAGPDVTRAQELVRRSGTAGDELVVAITAFQEETLASRFVPTLRDLGYDVEVRVVPSEQAILYGETLPPDADMSLIAWAQAYPSAAEFLVPLLACPSPSGKGHSIQGVEQTSFNPYGFCRPDLDRRMQRALDLKLTDPYGSARAWESIDHDVVDLAPLVPYVTGNNLFLVSERVGNAQANPQLGGVLISQAWIR